MARDHRKLRVFHQAHDLTIAIYKSTRDFPRDEWFGTRAQLRRAAVAVPSNVVEGSARRSAREYRNFLNIARASAAEVAYLVDLAFELGFLATDAFKDLKRRCNDLVPQLETLVQQVELFIANEHKARRSKASRQEPRA